MNGTKSIVGVSLKQKGNTVYWSARFFCGEDLIFSCSVCATSQRDAFNRANEKYDDWYGKQNYRVHYNPPN